MKKQKKILLITAAALVVGGLVLTGIGLAIGGEVGFQIGANGIRTTKDYEEAYIEKRASLDNVKNLSLAMDSGSIQIVKGDEFRIEYGYPEGSENLVETMEGSTFRLESKYATSYFGSISFLSSIPLDMQQTYVKVYMPDDIKLESLRITNDYGKIDIETGIVDLININANSGEVRMAEIACETANIEADYGQVEIIVGRFDDLSINSESGNLILEDIMADQIESTAGDGDVTLKQIETGGLSINAEAGAVSLDGVSGESVSVINHYGKTRFETITADQLDLYNESGDIVGSKVAVKKLKAESDYGNISLELTGAEEEYDIDAKTDYGEVKINGEDYGTSVVREKDAENTLVLSAESGKISIDTMR